MLTESAYGCEDFDVKKASRRMCNHFTTGCAIQPFTSRLGVGLHLRHFQRQRRLNLCKDGRVVLVGLAGHRVRELLKDRLVLIADPAAGEERCRLPRPPADERGVFHLVLAVDNLRDTALAAVIPWFTLAAAHARAGAFPHALDAVDREGATESLDDLRLRHPLALADHINLGGDAQGVDAGLVVGRVDEPKKTLTNI